MPETWEEIKSYREEKGLSLEALSERLRLPVHRIMYIEKGDFSDADPVIIRLHLKNYALQVGLEYGKLLELSGLDQKKQTHTPENYTEKTIVKKTRSYRGRRKEPSKVLIYSSIALGVFLLIFGLNKLFTHLEIRDDLFEMTDKQRFALDHEQDQNVDSLRYRPVIPQVVRQTEAIDITEDMRILSEFSVTFPVRLNVFPRKTLTFRHEISNDQPREDYILKDRPQSLVFNRSGRMIFHHTEDSRFVFGDLAFREKDYSRVVVEISSEGQAFVYVK
ncbi:MAG: helix-turn-helix domain-containing protein [FCB group bacterium]|nr:helix-turn-helix domain-containing protein [FCB group bacterium]